AGRRAGTRIVRRAVYTRGLFTISDATAATKRRSPNAIRSHCYFKRLLAISAQPTSGRVSAGHSGSKRPCTGHREAILASRIDRLRAPNKGLLQATAVLGKDAPYTALRTVAGSS